MSKETLTIKKCDLLKSKNASSHHTDKYETDSSQLVVRRGQPFSLRLELSRDMEFMKDKIKFEFHIGGRPRTSQMSRIILNQIDAKSGDSQVGALFSTVSGGSTLDVEIRTSAEMGVGQWTLWMYSTYNRKTTKSLVSANIVMLFNAWNKNDAVYMENDGWRNEYVLNDEGRLYYGSARRIGGMDWYFAQFEKKVLQAVLKLLGLDEGDKLIYRERGDPVIVSRHLSAAVNSNDGNGVLVGNWSGEYEDGESPTAWHGSLRILEQYVDTEKPVKYGQCWVFSGVLCSVLRALGIPARSITNFESAHDTDSNLTIDYHYDENDKALDNDDSVWNFHVWNDVWMARPDLPSGFGGWQALDATPQELSGYMFRCGPMPLAAIKQGMINMNYDGAFIYAEVNGTKRHWRVLPNGEYEELYSQPAAIGKNISTKSYDSDIKEDITHMYKYEEGSVDEMLSFKTARKYAKFTKVERKETKDVVKFEVEIPDNVLIGDSIEAKFKFTNLTPKTSHDLYLGIVGKVMQYNGSVVGKIYSEEIRERIEGGKSKIVTKTIPADAYLGKAKNNDNIKFFVLGGVKGPTNNKLIQTYVYHDSVEIDKPVISVKASPSTVQSGKTCVITISFTNPLSTPLSPGKLSLEGSGVNGVLEINVPKVKSKGKYTKEVKVVPVKTGNRKVIVGYTSKTLSGMQGSVTIRVTEPK